MHIALPPEFEAYVNDLVSSGQYASAEDVVANALKARMQAEVDERLAASRAAYKRGEYVVADDAFFDAKRQKIKDKHELP